MCERPNEVRIHDRALMTLEYLRQRGTYLHISKDYGISAGACFRSIRWAEDVLAKSKEVKPQQRRALGFPNCCEHEVILV